MGKNKTFLLKNATLTGVKNWLNIYFKKSNGKIFTISDVQQYCQKTGKLPDYIGGNIIITNINEFGIKTYNILKNGKNSD